MDYIDKLNALRDAVGISMRRLSFDCELSTLTVTNILNRITKDPYVSSIEKISFALGISLADLFCDKDKAVIRNDDPSRLILGIFDALSPEAQSHLLWIADRLKGY